MNYYNNNKNPELTDFLSSASFLLPNSIKSSAWHQHAPFAFWMMKTLRPRCFVELGSHYGFSYLTFCQAAKEFSIDTKGYAIDTWQGDEHAGFYGDEVYETLKSYHEPHYAGFSSLIRSTFDDALNHFPDHSIDLLHIDGRHYYEDVKHDFETWKNKLSDRSIVLFHDTIVKEHDFGVYKLWEQLTKEYPTFEFLHGHGLGVLGFGNTFPEPINKLFKANSDPDLSEQLRTAYYNLGQAVEDKFTLEAKSSEITSQREQFDKITTEQTQHISSLKSQIIDLESKVNNLKNQLDNSDNTVQQLEHTLGVERHKHQIFMNSSKRLFKALIKKMSHAPREISRRIRKSGQKSVMKPKEQSVNFFNSKRYRKYFISNLILKLKPILSKNFADRMQRRRDKNTPDYLTSQNKYDNQTSFSPKAPPLFAFDTFIEFSDRSDNDCIVDVIIPVYKGYDDTLACIHSVLQSRNDVSFEIIVINDCSPDDNLSEALNVLASKKLITLLKNKKNLGFVKTVNRGMLLHKDRDALLLNSDTLVFNNWLDRIHRHAYSGNNIASVTPFTNNGTICSYPIFCKDNTAQLQLQYSQIDQIASIVNSNQSLDIPTAVGFCMYIPRKAINKIGLFDEESFGKGYGEENDFSMRAQKQNWRNVHALDTFVFHSGETSFGATAKDEQARGLKKLIRIHPEYNDIVANFVANDPARQARMIIDAASMLIPGYSSSVLCFTHTLGGGIDRYLHDKREQLQQQAINMYIAKPKDDGYFCIKRFDQELPFPNLRSLSINNDLEYVVNALKSLKIKTIEIHSTFGWPFEMLEFVQRLSEESGIKLSFFVHDYISICPRIQLLKDQLYCGEEGVKQCDICLSNNPPRIHNNLPKVDIRTWREKYHKLLASADNVSAPSKDTANRINRYYNDIQISVEPHIEELTNRAIKSAVPYVQGILKVVVIGTLAPHKGRDVILSCLVDAKKRNLPIQFVIVGSAHKDREFAKFKNIQILGSYEDKNVFKITYKYFRKKYIEAGGFESGLS